MPEDTPGILPNDPLQVKPLLNLAWDDYDNHQQGIGSSPGLTDSASFINRHAERNLGISVEEYRQRAALEATGLDLDALVEEVRQGKKPLTALQEARARNVLYLDPKGKEKAAHQKVLDAQKAKVAAKLEEKGIEAPKSTSSRVQVQQSEETSGLLDQMPFIGDDTPDTLVSKGNEAGRVYAAQVVDTILTDDDVGKKRAKLIEKWSQEDLGASHWVKYRQREALVNAGFNPKNPTQEQLEWVEAQKGQHVREVALFKMLEMWPGAALINMDELDSADLPKDRSYFEKLLRAGLMPVVEIVGIGNHNQIITRAASLPRHMFDVFSTPESFHSPIVADRLKKATATVREAGLPDIAALPLAAVGLGPASMLLVPPDLKKEDFLDSIAGRDNYMEVALASDIAQTSLPAKIGMGVVGFGGSLLAWDLSTVFGPMVKVGGKALALPGKIKAGRAVEAAFDARIAEDWDAVNAAEAALRKDYLEHAKDVDIDDFAIADQHRERAPVLEQATRDLHNDLPEEMADHMRAAHPALRKMASEAVGPETGGVWQTSGHGHRFDTGARLDDVAQLEARAKVRDPTLLAHRLKPQMDAPLANLERTLRAAGVSAKDAEDITKAMVAQRKAIMADPDGWYSGFEKMIDAALPKGASTGAHKAAKAAGGQIRNTAKRLPRKAAEWKKLGDALGKAREAILFNSDARAHALARQYKKIRGKKLKVGGRAGQIPVADREGLSASGMLFARKLSALSGGTIDMDQAVAVALRGEDHARSWARRSGRDASTWWADHIGKLEQAPLPPKAAPPGPPAGPPAGPPPGPPAGTPPAAPVRPPTVLPLAGTPRPIAQPGPRPPLRPPAPGAAQRLRLVELAIARDVPEDLRALALTQAKAIDALILREGGEHVIATVRYARTKKGRSLTYPLTESIDGKRLDLTGTIGRRLLVEHDLRFRPALQPENPDYFRYIEKAEGVAPGPVPTKAIEPVVPAATPTPVPTRDFEGIGGDRVDVALQVADKLDAILRDAQVPARVVFGEDAGGDAFILTLGNTDDAPRMVEIPADVLRKVALRGIRLRQTNGVWLARTTVRRPTPVVPEVVPDVPATPAPAAWRPPPGPERAPPRVFDDDPVPVPEAPPPKPPEPVLVSPDEPVPSPDATGPMGPKAPAELMTPPVPEPEIIRKPAPRRRPGRPARDERLVYVPDSRKDVFRDLAETINGMLPKGVKVKEFMATDGVNYRITFVDEAGKPYRKALPPQVLKAVESVGTKVRTMGMGTGARAIRFRDTTFQPPVWKGKDAGPIFNVWADWGRRQRLLDKAAELEKLLGLPPRMISGGVGPRYVIELRSIAAGSSPRRAAMTGSSSSTCRQCRRRLRRSLRLRRRRSPCRGRRPRSRPLP